MKFLLKYIEILQRLKDLRASAASCCIGPSQKGAPASHDFAGCCGLGLPTRSTVSALLGTACARSWRKEMPWCCCVVYVSNSPHVCEYNEVWIWMYKTKAAELYTCTCDAWPLTMDHPFWRTVCLMPSHPIVNSWRKLNLESPSHLGTNNYYSKFGTNNYSCWSCAMPTSSSTSCCNSQHPPVVIQTRNPHSNPRKDRKVFPGW